MSVFSDAIKVLEERGWHQGSYGPGISPSDNGTSVCVLGAIAFANGYEPQAIRRLSLCEFHLREEHVLEHIVNGCDVGSWNDDPHTTYEDVVLALKRAHELTEAGA